MKYETSYKRMKELMDIHADVQFLEVGTECTEQEKSDVITFVLENLPRASEAIANMINT